MNYTSIEQSKKLLELGLSPESADMYWDINDTGGRNYTIHVGKSIAIERELFSFRQGLVIPAWSLAALLELMPDFIQEQQIDIRKNQYYQIAYGCWTDSGSWKDMISTPQCETPLEAAYNMVFYLLENGYIKKEKQHD